MYYQWVCPSYARLMLRDNGYHELLLRELRISKHMNVKKKEKEHATREYRHYHEVEAIMSLIAFLNWLNRTG